MAKCETYRSRHSRNLVMQETVNCILCVIIGPFIQAFADALLVIPKVLAQNSGLDPQETIVKLQHEFNANEGKVPVGIDLQSGK